MSAARAPKRTQPGAGEKPDGVGAGPRSRVVRRGLDPRVPGFADEARRQAKLIASSPHAKEDQDFVDAISISFDDLD